MASTSFVWQHSSGNISRTYTLSFEKPLIMGIVNVTPDSFSDGGKYFGAATAVQHALQLVKDGADILDIGGESTRPGSAPVPVEEELKRVIPIIKQLGKKITMPISIDTYKPEVARAAFTAGASMLNDITGLQNPEMMKLIAHVKVPVVMMHMQGTPQIMQQQPHYENVVKEVYDFFKRQIAVAKKHGIKHVILDPGIGFGKTLEHNLELLKHLKFFHDLKKPLLVGTSRK